MYWLGIVGTFSCSWVGIIDMDLCNPIHSTFATSFYIATEAYFFLLVS